jgi:hypothetical protein
MICDFLQRAAPEPECQGVNTRLSVGDDARPGIRSEIAPLPAEVLTARDTVVDFKARWLPLAKPGYVNTDASWRDGMAGVAYESGAMGRRVELVACGSNLAGEYLALLMAMGDADVCLEGRVIFRVDSAALIDRNVRRTPELVELCERIEALLASHADWTLTLVSKRRNKFAHRLSRRPFLAIDRSEWVTRVLSVSCEEKE